MATPVLTFFNNKGGVGQTSLVYHLAWMYADLGQTVVAADLDPQANLSGMFLDEDRLETLWTDKGPRRTVYGALQPLLEGTGDIVSPHLEKPGDRLSLIVGDLKLSSAEEELSGQWPACLDRQPRAFRVISALWRILQKAADSSHATLILADVGPNLGALNRAALVATDYVAVPLAGDLYSLQGLRNLGPTLRTGAVNGRTVAVETQSKAFPSPRGRCSLSGTWCSSIASVWAGRLRHSTGGSTGYLKSTPRTCWN